MDQTYQYAWIIPFVPLTLSMLIVVGLLLFPTETKNIRRLWAFLTILLLSIVMIFSTNLSIEQINSSSIHQYVWSWTLENDFSLEFGYLIGIITVLLGATLAIAEKDIKRGLAYSTMSQLGYMMLALGMGSYRSALFHLITHAYSKALLFLGSGSLIHSMETIVGYSPHKTQNMVLMGGLTKHIPITKTSFLLDTFSLCGIPPLACFWSKDEIINASWLYSPIFAIIAWATAGLTVFYMFRIYLLNFEGHLNIDFKNYSGNQNSFIYSISLWGRGLQKELTRIFIY